MDSSDADIVDPLHGACHGFAGYDRLFGDGNITRARAHNSNVSGELFRRVNHNCDRPRRFMMNRIRIRLEHRADDFRAAARREDVAAVFAHAAYDLHDLLRGLARAEDRLWKSFSQAPVMIYLGKPEILEGQCPQAFNSILRIKLSTSDGLQEALELILIHAALPVRYRIAMYITKKGEHYKARFFGDLARGNALHGADAASGPPLAHGNGKSILAEDSSGPLLQGIVLTAELLTVIADSW